MLSGKKIKVLIVDDSLLFREGLSRELSKDPAIEIVAKAENPFQARDYIIEYKPDVMTCDIEMPKMNGLEFVRKLIPQYPLPVIIVSSANDAVFDAIDAGAIDFEAKPGGGSPLGIKRLADELIPKIKSAVDARVEVNKPKKLPHTKPNDSYCFDYKMLIAIGASTGGTEAIYRILSELPQGIPGILVVQHIPPVFSRMFAERLNKQLTLHVKEADNGEDIERDTVYIAPGDMHMAVKKVGAKYKIKLFNGEKVNGHCPSVDVLFSSVAKECGTNAIGVLLTGMGQDGANGLLQLKNSGAFTIGQDEKTSVVYGMPKVAYNIGAVTKQLELDAIPSSVISAICRKQI